jgi:hypothetical protein
MKYLCLIYGVESAVAAMPPAEMKSFAGEFQSLTETLKHNGQWLAGERLRPVQSATTVRVRDGKVSTTDGPFAETKEQLGGFYMLEARDLNDAIQVASRIPSARIGSVEVRPVWEMAG